MKEAFTSSIRVVSSWTVYANGESFTDRGHGSYRLPACRGSSLVHRAILTRHLIVSLQNILIYPEFARGSLDILGSLQAKEDDPYRDAEPGKIFHELRYGELAHFKLIPHTPYYGTADATPLYLITLHAAWRATGDQTLLERHLETIEGCLSWIDHYGDRDGDGFQEYQTRSPVGYDTISTSE